MTDLEEYLKEKEKLITVCAVRVPLIVVGLSLFILLFLSFDSSSMVSIISGSFSLLGTISIGLSGKIKSHCLTKGWKKKFPQYDIEGKWKDVTKYTKEISDDGFKETQKKSDGIAKIKQSGLRIEIKSSPSDDLTWYSNFVEWKGDGRLMIFYTVDYHEPKQRDQFPDQRIGYEVMSIASHDPATKKPNKMKGKFYHCIKDDGKPMYMGDVEYTREL
ncbi:MAG: hypothetical protein LBM75_05325 [Myxococcales bacterium]|jgi:hypothetical protein|nr:hypothetical protein [Myxococcales bacterium]